jgi:hypothetical protein
MRRAILTLTAIAAIGLLLTIARTPPMVTVTVPDCAHPVPGKACHRGDMINDRQGTTAPLPNINGDTVTMPACATEDAPNCIWLGGTNGTGRHFIDIAGHAYPL